MYLQLQTNHPLFRVLHSLLLSCSSSSPVALRDGFLLRALVKFAQLVRARGLQSPGAAWGVGNGTQRHNTQASTSVNATAPGPFPPLPPPGRRPLPLPPPPPYLVLAKAHWCRSICAPYLMFSRSTSAHGTTTPNLLMQQCARAQDLYAGVAWCAVCGVWEGRAQEARRRIVVRQGAQPGRVVGVVCGICVWCMGMCVWDVCA